MTDKELIERRQWINEQQNAIIKCNTVIELNRFYAKYCKELYNLNEEISKDIRDKIDFQSKVEDMRDRYFIIDGMINYENMLISRLN